MSFEEKKTPGQRLFFYYRKSIAVIAFLVFWEIAPRVGLADRMFIPPLSEILVTGAQMFISGNLLPHIGVSLRRAMLGFAIAALAALPLGFLLGGWFRRFEEYLDPLLKVMAQINPFSVFPVFILLFGIS
jgi:NitT/TauT family transport system permease protein